MAVKRLSRNNAQIIATDAGVPFQGVPFPYSIRHEDEERIFKIAMENDIPLYITPLADPKAPSDFGNLCHYGVEVKTVRVVELPDGTKNAFLIGNERFRVFPEQKIDNLLYTGHVKAAPDRLHSKNSKGFFAIMHMLEEVYEYVKEYFSEVAKIQMAPPKELHEDPRVYLNFIIITSPVEYTDRVALLMEADLYKRAEKLLGILQLIKEQIEIRKEIYARTAAELDSEQKEHFLRTQIRQIQQEIGDDSSSDVDSLRERAKKKNWNEETAHFFEKELAKLNRFNPTTPDYALQYTYLDTILNLPWNNVAESEIDLDKLTEDLDRDHYGLEKIKERITEHMAVLKLRGDMRSPIICLYGPPGVGKTSLCKSIAESIGRDYVRVSLGGLHDETQIRGHRRTYIGALPGRIISSLAKCKTNNPVFVLDEIDKIGNDHRGDPAQAFLEVLDPEQNSCFHDNYLDVDYDLSKVFFIATANNLSTISKPLLDRMEVIEISGYLPEEKIEIGKRHLVSKQLENHGFAKDEITFTDDALQAIIESYTRESGVRGMEKMIAKALRKLAVKKARGVRFPKKIDRKLLVSLLGKEDILPEKFEGSLPVGVVAGLAWTPVGGEILYFESSLSKGKGVLTLTGNMGDVMKESATIALQWVKAHAESLGIEAERFATTDVHLHVPEGAVPKDGPSAGITMVTSIAGSFTGRKTRDKVAMTGEVTLSGKVLPVGGVKEKILAAKRAGYTDIILSGKNRRDIEDIDKRYTKGLKFHYVEMVNEVIDFALLTD